MTKYLIPSYRPMWLLLALGMSLDVLTYIVWSAISSDNGAVERNPIIVFIVANFGIMGFALVKLGYVAWIRQRLGRARFSWKVYFVLSIAAASCFVGAIFNSLAIIG